MKTLFLGIFMLMATPMFAHEYYFAFAEVEYNDVSKKFETTLVISTHDFEKTLQKRLLIKTSLENAQNNDEAYLRMESFILEHYAISTSHGKVDLKIIGIEINLDGTTNIYIESSPVDLTMEITIMFDIFMDEYSSQQNKIMFHHRNTRLTLPLLNEKRIQKIKLESI